LEKLILEFVLIPEKKKSPFGTSKKFPFLIMEKLMINLCRIDDVDVVVLLNLFFVKFFS